MKLSRIYLATFFLILTLCTTQLLMSGSCKRFDKNVSVEKLLCACKLLVKMCATINGNLTVNGNTVFNGNTKLKGNLTLDGNLTVNGDTFLHEDLTVDGDSTFHGNVTIDGNITVTGKILGKLFGNVVRVDKVLGDDATGERNGPPFLTINAALAVAQAGDMVWIFPGTYNETFTIPANIAVVGVDKTVVTIQQTNVTADTDLVTIGENSSLESVSLNLDSAEHHQLRGIVLPGTTSKTAQIRNVCILVDNSSASLAGGSNVYGINSIGTGIPDNTQVCIANTSIDVRSIGTGLARGILVNTANSLIVRDTEIITIGIGGGGSFIGAETSDVNALLELNFCTSSGSSADISQTLGILAIDSTKLLNFNANGFGFTVIPYPSTMAFCDPGTLAGGNRYMYPGTNSASTNEIVLPFSQQAIVKALTVRSRVAPGGTDIDTWTFRKNGVDTALQVQLSGSATFAKNDSVSISIAPSDLISIKVLEDPAGSSTQDPVVIIDIY
ncbi:hypothetical protein ACFLYU_01105 [Candidatus Dependentiae bacterium]